MTILFLSYWGINEGLSSATVIPHVEILAKHPLVERIILVTIEREKYVQPALPDGVKHIALDSKHKGNVFVTKFLDFTKFPLRIKALCREYQVDWMMCRSSLAGALGYLVWRTMRIRYTVESFEPHASYMIDAGIWKKWDPRYLLQRYFEYKQRKTAAWLLPVAENYRNYLAKEGVPARKIITVPCCVDLKRFAFSMKHRQELREKLQIPDNAIVGIYVGKFGGIYYEQEAFQLFRKAQDFLGPSFYLIALTDYDRSELNFRFQKENIDINRVRIDLVPHIEVPSYLSAADFAFTLYKRMSSAKFLSPIKIGEYWANGLPIVIEEGIGDDACIVVSEGAGSVFNIYDPDIGFKALLTLISKGRIKLVSEIEKVAAKHRSFVKVASAYHRILES